MGNKILCPYCNKETAIINPEKVGVDVKTNKQQVVVGSHIALKGNCYYCEKEILFGIVLT